MMNKISAALLAGIASTALLATSTSAQFKSGTLTVPLYVTVTDSENRLVPDLVRG